MLCTSSSSYFIRIRRKPRQRKRKRTLNRLRARMGTQKKRQVWRVSATKRIVPPKKTDRSKDKLICRGGQSATSALLCNQPTLLSQRNPRPPSRHPCCCSVRNCSTTAFAFFVGTAAEYTSTQPSLLLLLPKKTYIGYVR